MLLTPSVLEGSSSRELVWGNQVWQGHHHQQAAACQKHTPPLPLLLLLVPLQHQRLQLRVVSRLAPHQQH